MYDAIRRLGLRHVLVNDERAAAFAADAYARASGRVGVCDATLGPGATNLITGLVEATNAGTPVIAIVGDANRSHAGKGMTQEAEQVRLLRPAVKELLRVEVGTRIPELVRRAHASPPAAGPAPSSSTSPRTSPTASGSTTSPTSPPPSRPRARPARARAPPRRTSKRPPGCSLRAPRPGPSSSPAAASTSRAPTTRWPSWPPPCPSPSRTHLRQGRARPARIRSTPGSSAATRAWRTT